MKLLVLAALIAVAAAYPEVRERRSAVWGAPIASGTIVKGASAVLNGPSAVLAADTGAIAAPAHAPAATVVAAPAWGHGLVGVPAWNTWGHSGAVIGHSGVVVGHGLGLHGLGLGHGGVILG